MRKGLHVTASRDGVSVVEHDELGVLGTVHRARRGYRGVTPRGVESAVLTAKSDAALWLLFQVRHPQAPPPPPDVVAEMLKRHVERGDLAGAESAALAAIAQEIDSMRQARGRKTPPALWWHLNRMSTWLELVTSAAAERPAEVGAGGRLTHLVVSGA